MADAREYLLAVLNQAGLGHMAGDAFGWIQQGLSEIQIIQNLRQRQEWKDRFGAIEDFKRQFPNLQPPSEAEVLRFETDAAQLMRNAGFPQGYYDQPQDFRRFIANNVSIKELSDRVEEGRKRVYESPKEDREEYARLYGFTDGDFLALTLDEKRALPLLQKQLDAAAKSGAAIRAGFGALTTQEAERLGDLGITQQQATEGFGALADSRELFGALPGSAEDAISRQEQLSVIGGDAAAQAKVRKRARERKTPFESGGSFASSNEGITGLGSA